MIDILKISNIFVIHTNYKRYLEQLIRLLANIYQYKVDIILTNGTLSMPHKNKLLVFNFKFKIILKHKQEVGDDLSVCVLNHLTRPCDQSCNIIGKSSSREAIILPSLLAIHSCNRDMMVFVCHVTLQDHMIKALYDFMPVKAYHHPSLVEI